MYFYLHKEFFQKIRSDLIYTKNFQEGRCDRKWRFYNKETAFAGVQHLGLDGVKSMFFAFVSSVEIHDWSLFKSEMRRFVFGSCLSGGRVLAQTQSSGVEKGRNGYLPARQCKEDRPEWYSTTEGKRVGPGRYSTAGERTWPAER